MTISHFHLRSIFCIFTVPIIIYMKSSFPFEKLAQFIEGELLTDNINRIIYATDGSSYREIPLAVVIPKHKSDVQKVLAFAREYKTSVIPRGAGTSLAGQVVGAGIVVDISKYMDRILKFNREEHWIKVEPGVNLTVCSLAPKLRQQTVAGWVEC